MAVENVEVPYEVLIRFAPDGAYAGSHYIARTAVVVDGTVVSVSDPQLPMPLPLEANARWSLTLGALLNDLSTGWIADAEVKVARIAALEAAAVEAAEAHQAALRAQETALQAAFAESRESARASRQVERDRELARLSAHFGVTLEQLATIMAGGGQ